MDQKKKTEIHPQITLWRNPTSAKRTLPLQYTDSSSTWEENLAKTIQHYDINFTSIEMSRLYSFYSQWESDLGLREWLGFNWDMYWKWFKLINTTTTVVLGLHDLIFLILMLIQSLASTYFISKVKSLISIGAKGRYKYHIETLSIKNI